MKEKVLKPKGHQVQFEPRLKRRTITLTSKIDASIEMKMRETGVKRSTLIQQALEEAGYG